MDMLCGIDEAGRGPIAGDLVVAGCILHSEIKALNDSKKLTEKKRKILFDEIVKNSTYHIVVYPAKKSRCRWDICMYARSPKRDTKTTRCTNLPF